MRSIANRGFSVLYSISVNLPDMQVERNGLQPYGIIDWRNNPKEEASMKHFDDLSFKEKAALSDEEINEYIQIQLAIDGVIPLEKPIKHELRLEELGVKKCVKVYKIKGVMVPTLEVAEVIAQLPILTSTYDYSGLGYEYEYVEEIKGSSVSIEYFYNKDDLDKVKVDAIEKLMKAEDFKIRNQEYEAYAKKHNEISEQILKNVLESRRRVDELSNAINVFSKYLDLTGRDYDEAESLLITAYGDKKEIVNEVLDYYKSNQ